MSENDVHAEFEINFPEKYVQSVHKFVDNCLVARLGRGLNENSFEKVISRAGGDG